MRVESPFPNFFPRLKVSLSFLLFTFQLFWHYLFIFLLRDDPLQVFRHVSVTCVSRGHAYRRYIPEK